MFVLDTTASMASTTDDTGCAVPNVSSPKKIDCAKYGIRFILKQLNPAIDKVGVMAFPGMSKNRTPCTGSPSIEPYGTSGIIYQINGTTLSTDYATTIGKLNDSSALVLAVGDNVNKLTGCLSAPGGEGTFYAEAISAAQSALVARGFAHGAECDHFPQRRRSQPGTGRRQDGRHIRAHRLLAERELLARTSGTAVQPGS